MSRFAASLEKLDALIEEDETFSENTRAFLKITTSGLRHSIQPENLGNGFDSYQQFYNADAINKLYIASDILKRKYPMRQLTEQQISELAQMITECFIVVDGLDIEDRWKIILRDKLLDFSDLLTNINTMGSDRIIESAGGFAGYVVTLGRQHQQVSDNLGSIAAKMLEFAGHVSLVWDATTPVRNIITSPDILSRLMSG